MAGQPMWAEGLLLVTTVGGLVAYRGSEYGDFLAAGMGLTVGAAVVTAIAPARFSSRRLVARLKSARLRAGIAIVAFYLAAGMVGQVLGLEALRRGERSVKATDYAGAYRAYSTGSRVAQVFRPFTFYLDDFDGRAGIHASRMMSQGDRLMTSASWEDAEFVYRTVLALEPDQIQARGNLGTALFKQSRFWEAATCYLAVLEYDPNDLVALYHLAMTRIQLGQMDDAVVLVQTILTIDTVGNAFDLIRENPLFRLLSGHPGYRRVMAVYQPQRDAGSLKGEMTQ